MGAAGLSRYFVSIRDFPGECHDIPLQPKRVLMSARKIQRVPARGWQPWYWRMAVSGWTPTVEWGTVPVIVAQDLYQAA